jgi:hypothetical protein
VPVGSALIDMWRVGIVLAIGIAASAAAPAPKTMKDLTFLTRDGCVNTPDMVNNLDDALKALGWPNDYQFIDIGKLRSGEVRTGYPTPTLLWKGKDIFGMLLRSRSSTSQVDASTRAEFRPSKRFKNG